jgi:hypothetical protein
MHAIRNDIDEATVYTSDLDFFPLFEALLQSKTRSHLGYQIGKTSLELIQAADYAEPLTFVDFNSWLSVDTKFHTGSVSMSQSQLSEFRPIGSGTVAGKAFELKKHDRMGRYAAFVEGKRIGPSMKSRLYEEGEVEKRFKAKINYTTSPE